MEYYVGSLSEGFEHDGRIRAICECGWTGPWHLGLSGSLEAVAGERDEHGAGHGRVFCAGFYEDHVRGIGYHVACGHHHRLNDDCPVPSDSWLGLVRRVFQATVASPEIARDRLAAVVALVNLGAVEGPGAVLGARMAGVGWDEVEAVLSKVVGEAAGSWCDAARYGERIGAVVASSTKTPSTKKESVEEPAPARW